jgi:hypothetical protein
MRLLLRLRIKYGAGFEYEQKDKPECTSYKIPIPKSNLQEKAWH